MVLDPPLASAPPVAPRLTKPTELAKGKQSIVPEEKESLAARSARLQAKQEKKEKELLDAKFRCYEAAPASQKALVAKQLKIDHLLAAKADTQCRLTQAAEGEGRAAVVVAQLEKQLRQGNHQQFSD